MKDIDRAMKRNCLYPRSSCRNDHKSYPKRARWKHLFDLCVCMWILSNHRKCPVDRREQTSHRQEKNGLGSHVYWKNRQSFGSPAIFLSFYKKRWNFIASSQVASHYVSSHAWKQLSQPKESISSFCQYLICTIALLSSASHLNPSFWKLLLWKGFRSLEVEMSCWLLPT